MGDGLREDPILCGEGRGVHGRTGPGAWVAARVAAPGALWALLVVAAFVAGCGSSEAPAEPTREVSLDGLWLMQLDPQGRGAEEGWLEALTTGERPQGAASEAFVIEVPGPLEGAPQTALVDLGTLRGYDGVVWYVRRFVAPPEVEGARIDLALDRVNYAARVHLDGVFIGAHEGGYGPARFDLTGKLEAGEEHCLVVRVVDPGSVPVDGLTLSTTPHGKESWYHNFGGLLGSTRLRLHVAPAIARLSVVPDAGGGEVWVDVDVVAPPGSAGDASADDAGSQTVRIGLSVDGGRALHFDVDLSDGRGSAARRIVVAEPTLWSPESPHLYTLSTTIAGAPGPQRTFGFRDFTVADGDLFLNGERRVLHGVLYQPHVPGLGGRDPDPAFLREEVEGILDTGFDFVRMHVAPAPEAFLQACDELGLLVLAEPAIGWLEDDPQLLPRLRDEIDWMVRRDRQHPSVILWGVLNEMSGKAYVHAEELSAHLADLDPTRMVLEDSGGFLGGGRYREPFTGARRAMIDVHLYPPYPLPPERHAEMEGLGADVEGPVFVSEFGYGAMLDAARARDGYIDRGLHGEERALFEGFADRQRRARAAAGPWNDDDWWAAAAGLSADAAEDMTEALRSNPALDLACYTQWRAVSSEASAGLLAPWGEPRPARERLNRALRPLLTTVALVERSVRPGRDTEVTASVVNDTGGSVSGHLFVQALPSAGGEALDIDVGEHEFAPGVTAFTVPLPLGLGPRDLADWSISAVLEGAAGVLDVSTPRRLVVVPTPPDRRPAPRGSWPLSVWIPDDDPEARAFARRQGFTVYGGSGVADVVLLARPDRLTSTLTAAQRLQLWRWVWNGGPVVALLPPPGGGALAPGQATRRAVEILHGVPLDLLARPAAGHFMGRFHLIATDPGGDVPRLLSAHDDDAELRMLGRGDEVIAPRALLWGGPGPDDAAASVTLDHLGGIIGTSHLRRGFGEGFVELLGAPLLDPLGAQVEPRRDHLLAEVLVTAASAGHGARASAVPAAPLPQHLLDSWALVTARVARLAGLGSRVSPFAPLVRGELALPPLLAQALARKNAALVTFLQGDEEGFVRQALSLLTATGDEDLTDFLGREAAVFAALVAVVSEPRPETARVAHDALEHWVIAVGRAFAGDHAAADQALTRAASSLRESVGGAPPR